MGFAWMTILPPPFYHKRVGKRHLPRSIPELQGVSSAGLVSFLDEVAKSGIEFHSVMVVRHGHVVAEGWWEPYAPALKHTLYSLSKSFTSTAVGLAVSEGHLDIDMPVVSFFPSEVPPEIDPKLASMKVRHLLTMSTGHVKDTIQPMRHSTEPWVKTFLSLPVEREPGTFFLYNTGATYILSAIVQRVTGQTLLQYLRPRIFEPLGIYGEDWETDPVGINTGGYGLRVTTEDLAKFGQLYLQNGKWNGKQLLSPQWIAEATRKQIESNSSNPSRPREEDDWAQGYGYQFWRCRPGGYRADGAFGQFSMVMPEYDAVIAITGESFSMQRSMNLVWSYLLPAIDKRNRTLPPDEPAQKRLAENLKALYLEPPRYNKTSPLVRELSGKEFVLEKNEFNGVSFVLDFDASKCVFTLKNDNGGHVVTCGINAWIDQMNAGKGTPFPVAGRMDVTTALAGSATWKDDRTLLMTWRLIESAHTNGLTFVFDDKNVTVNFHSSLSLSNPNGVDQRQPLKGSMA